MDNIVTTTKLVFATLGGIIGGLYGGWNVGLKVLFIMVVLDYITGMIASGYQGKLSSNIGIKGILKKLMIFIVVYVAVLLDEALGTHIQIFNFNATVRMATCFFYIGNEAISILENVDRCDVAIPSFLRNLLQQVKDRSDQNMEKENESNI